MAHRARAGRIVQRLVAAAASSHVATAWAASAAGPEIFGIPVDFVLFALTLLGVGIFHHHTLAVALTGLAVIVAYKLGFTGFKAGAGIEGLGAHFAHEWVILTNLLGLLVGFALLARHFEESRVPAVLPRFLPDNWKGGVVLLALIFVLSAFLDNIAAALIGATIAGAVYRRKVHIGYLAAIVAASNAGGAGSVVGDTTTTMMWIDGVSAVAVLPAFIASAAALIVIGIPAALLQQRHSPIVKDASARTEVDWARVWIVVIILLAAVATNVTINSTAPELADRVPALGLAVWVVLLVTAGWRRPEWSLLPEAFKGSIFLLALVSCASMMPVEQLPAASWQTAFALGFVSSVFDNIPLTALALRQGGYDWALLAYAVGFGGSMIWFGSSAGVAVSNMYPEARSVGAWLKHGWFVAVAYVVGFFVMLALWGWQPGDKRERAAEAPMRIASLVARPPASHPSQPNTACARVAGDLLTPAKGA
ncbi:MAG: citrate transporter [Burkholderiales bacterium]|nr:citrate transporter [Burkholderiales bacterium]